MFQVFFQLLKKCKWLFKLSLSLMLLSYVMRQTDASAIESVVSRASLVWLGITVALVFFCIFLASYRWQLLLKSQEIKVPIQSLFFSYLVGSFFNMFLPTTIGGDLARSSYTTSATKSSVVSVSVVIIERVIGVISQIVVAIIALGFVGSQLSNQDDIWLIILLIIAVFTLVGICILYHKKFFQMFEGLTFLSAFRGKIEHLFDSLGNVFVLLKKRKKWVAYSLLISFAIQVVRILFHITMIVALKINIDLGLLFVFVPITLIVVMVPVAINGVGISENMYAYFFGFLGIGTNDSIAFSWLVLLFASLIPSLFGGMVFVSYNKTSKKALFNFL